jgi:hypothetical protein
VQPPQSSGAVHAFYPKIKINKRFLNGFFVVVVFNC